MATIVGRASTTDLTRLQATRFLYANATGHTTVSIELTGPAATVPVVQTNFADGAAARDVQADLRARPRVGADSRATFVESSTGLACGLALPQDRTESVLTTDSGTTVAVQGTKLAAAAAEGNHGAP